MLNPFEGQPVHSARIVVTKAGDGLSAPLDMDPRELHTGDRVYLVLECEVADVSFKPAKDADGFYRVHKLVTIEGMILDGDAGEQVMAAQTAKLAEWRDQRQREAEEAAGVQRMFVGDEDPEADDLDDEFGDDD